MLETSGEIRRNHYRTKENFQISRILSRWKIIFSTFNRCAISETEQILYNQYQSAISLKFKFFQAYVWPHMFMMSSIYCLMSHSNQNRLDSFYRRCLRLIYCLFQCPTDDLHNHFKLPTLKDRFRMSLQKRITRTWPTRFLLAIQRTEKRFVHPLPRKALYKILTRRSSKQSAYNTLHVFSTNQGCQISWLFINVTFIKQYDGILSESLRKYTYFHCSSLIVHSISTKIT